MTAATPADIPVLGSIAPLAATADAWISDIWGVLHNGLEAYPAAGEACRRFRKERGGTVILVTNAPRPAADVEQRLLELGLPPAAWDRIVTSGDVSRALVDAFPAGGTVYHLGPERDRGVLAGLEARLVETPERADLVMCTGLIDDERETPDDYRDQLALLARRSVPLICANPDIVVERGPRLVPCAGALAEIYADLGGPVHFAGKPHTPIYERAFAAIDEARGMLPNRSRILAIGDGLLTDMAGAERAGLRAVFIASALHVASGQPLDSGTISALFHPSRAAPVAAMPALAW